MSRILLFANTTWYLYNFRLGLARAIRQAGHEVTLLSPKDEYVARLEDEGFRWIEIRLDRRGMAPVRELRSFLACLGVYRRLQPDLVHHFTIKPVVYGSLAAFVASVPSVVNSVTGLGYAFVRSGVVGTILRRAAIVLYRWAMAGKSVRAIFENQTDLRLFVDLGIVPKARAVWVPGTGVDLTRFSPTPELAGVPVVVMASRMLWDKGVGALVEAARILHRQGTPVRVVLVGDPDPGNPSSVPAERLRSWSDEGIVEWVGHRDDMAAVYATSSIVVLPSHREGLPRSLVEAAACGRPIVASDVPGCRDVVEDGVNGILVASEDPPALAAALSHLLGDPDLRRTMGRRGREIAESRFSDPVVIEQTLRVYHDLRSHEAEGQRAGHA